MNIGTSTRLAYDDCAYPDRLSESVGPLSYRLSEYQIHNCDGCLSTMGPRSGFKGHGVSTLNGNRPATSQSLVDLESILSNRNVKTSKCKTGHVNEVDVTAFDLQHPAICNDYLNPQSSRLSYPVANYRDMSVNRFQNLPHNPQTNIFWDFSSNTRLEAKDNFSVKAPKLMKDVSHPPGFKNNKECTSNNGCQPSCPM
jgi:hypothetical protein